MSLTSPSLSSFVACLLLLTSCSEQAPLSGGVSEVVLDACPTPRAPTTTPTTTYFSPPVLTPVSSLCTANLALGSPFVLKRADGRIDFTDDVVDVLAASAEVRGEMCRVQLSVVGEVPPKEEGDPVVAPAPRSVTLRLCAPRLDVNLPLADLEPPVLRRLDIFGARQTTPLLTTLLPLQVAVRGVDETGACADGVAVDDFISRAIVTVDIPLRTLARVASRSVFGSLAVIVEVEPR